VNEVFELVRLAHLAARDASARRVQHLERKA
jgi:hypothetical protein